MDPHIFSDPDPGSQNVADPKDSDPKHCILPSVLLRKLQYCRIPSGYVSTSQLGKIQFL